MDVMRGYQEILNELQKEVSEIGAIALINLEGALIASVLPASYDSETLTAIASSTVSIAEESLRELKKAHLKRILIKGNQGFVLLHLIMGEFILVVMVNCNIKINILYQRVGETVNKIASLLRKG